VNLPLAVLKSELVSNSSASKTIVVHVAAGTVGPAADLYAQNLYGLVSLPTVTVPSTMARVVTVSAGSAVPLSRSARVIFFVTAPA
jgi:hypothetical protein